ETWQQSEARFTGEQIGEAKLTADTGLTSYYRLTGYRDQEGQEVLVEALNTPMPEAVPDGAARSAVAAEEPIPGNARPKRWLVNNGSQIIGPLTPEEIAVRLYSQELDLDCECWAEGNGNSAQIRSAGIFSGSEDEGASLWLFDGNTVHGPLSPGFLRTALLHGALPHDAWICQDTTTSGWKTIAHWDPTLAPPKATAPTEASVDSQQGAA
ncbi:MAG: hypothetical protein ACXWP5_15465, partial [Bdellovibrionota bacterium]